MEAAVLKQAQYKKRLATLRLLLTGARYFRALRALEFALRFHGTEFRKDEITPGFDHQVCLALHAWTLADLTDREGHIITIIWHDTPEDYQVRVFELVEHFPLDERAGVTPYAHSAELLNKYNRDGTPKDEDQMWDLIARDPFASIAKPVDRVHNLSTMNEARPDGEPVFSYAKQLDYADFAEFRVLPMMKIARRVFPEQTNAYINLKHMIENQISLVRIMAAAVNRASNVRQIEIKAVKA